LDNAVALSDIFEVAKILEKEGEAGLKKLVLKPLNPVSPALAGTKELVQQTSFPLWVECKYDGIRLLLHKETSNQGATKFAAFTRRKYDWLEMVFPLCSALKSIFAHSFILDGELHGKVTDLENGVREATVYEIYRNLQGDTTVPVRLQYIAFDILYINGRDVILLPFMERRKILEQLISPLSPMNFPIPILLSQGWQVEDSRGLQKWYQYFRSQGHEGIVAKVMDAPYSLGQRTNDWLKKKEAIYLDLALTGAFWSFAESGPKTFSSYQLCCRGERGFIPVAFAAGLDKQSNWEIIQRISQEGLLTGKALEYRSSSGTHTGIELAASIVVTVKFESIVADSQKQYSLRDPKIVQIRPKGDITIEDVDTYEIIRQLYLKQRLQ
jgi:DNA ligase-1